MALLSCIPYLGRTLSLWLVLISAVSQKPSLSWGGISLFCSRVVAAADHVGWAACRYCWWLCVMIVWIICMPSLSIHPRFHSKNNHFIVPWHTSWAHLPTQTDSCCLSLSCALSLHPATFVVVIVSIVYDYYYQKLLLNNWLASFVTDGWLRTWDHDSNWARIPLNFQDILLRHQCDALAVGFQFSSWSRSLSSSSKNFAPQWQMNPCISDPIAFSQWNRLHRYINHAIQIRNSWVHYEHTNPKWKHTCCAFKSQSTCFTLKKANL